MNDTINSRKYEAISKSNVNLLLIHGSSSTQATWNPILDFLMKYYNVTTYDLRGYGESPLGDKEYSMDQMIEDIEYVVKIRCLDKFIIIAHSMGVRIGVSYAAKYPEKVQGLILIDLHVLPNPLNNISNETQHIEYLKSFKERHSTENEVKQELTKYNLENRFDAWLADGRIRKLHSGEFLIPNTLYVGYLARKNISNSPITQEHFSHLNCPVLLVQAEKYSCVSTEGIDHMKKLQPTMKHIYIPGSEHSIHRTHPEIFVDICHEFIANAT
jgi:pimeloyl-ACP methyl ester carboxylesterase